MSSLTDARGRRRLAALWLISTSLLAACGGITHPHDALTTRTATAHTGASAAASAGPSWSEYLSSTPGHSCVLVGDESHVGSARIAAYLTQAVVSSSQGSSGERILYRATSRATSSEPGTPTLPPLSYLLPYEVQADGRLATSPGALPEPGFDVEWQGSELYPSIDELRAGKSAVSSLVLAVKASEAAAQHALEAELAPGQTQLKARFSATVSPVSGVRSVQTPDGTFTNVVGVRAELDSGEALDAGAAYAAKFAQLVGAMGKAFSGTTLYFAKGVGMVDSESSGSALKVEHCSG